MSKTYQRPLFSIDRVLKFGQNELKFAVLECYFKGKPTPIPGLSKTRRKISDKICIQISRCVRLFGRCATDAVGKRGGYGVRSASRTPPPSRNEQKDRATNETKATKATNATGANLSSTQAHAPSTMYTHVHMQAAGRQAGWQASRY